jgi:hypothetical protein
MTLHFQPSGAFSWQRTQTTSDVQAVIVRFATYIGVTILVVALAYKVAKVNNHCAWHAAKQVPSSADVCCA